MKLKLISCEIFFREMEFLLKRVPRAIDVEYLQKGLHDIPSDEMRLRIQARIDEASQADYDAILLGYGLCNNGLDGLAARGIPLVLPRAHDCITLFFGSRQRYRDYFEEHPGTYFKTTGWIERDDVAEELRPLSIPGQMGMDLTYAQLVERYGEDNAAYLWEELCNTKKNYSRITFIEMGVEPDDRFERSAEEEAKARHWSYEKVVGDLGLIRRLLNGEWDPEDFLVIPPGRRVAADYSTGIIRLADDI